MSQRLNKYGETREQALRRWHAQLMGTTSQRGLAAVHVLNRLYPAEEPLSSGEE